MENSCPKCKSSQRTKNGFVKDRQRYRCQNCKCSYTKSTPHGYSSQVKRLAYMLYLNGLGFRRIASIVGVSHVSVLRWVKQLASLLKDTKPKKQHCQVIEIDELWHYVGKKKENSGSGWLLIELQEPFWAGRLMVVEDVH